VSVIICGPDDRFLRKRYLRCPMCECVTESVVRYELWHGATVTCLRCGDMWGDGELYPRPFRPGWRRDRITRGRKLWDLATHGPEPTLQEMDPVMFAEFASRPVVDVVPTGGVL
jgi:hypothetical protein